MKHGISSTGTYKSWRNMIIRCYCKSATGYDNYGGRGIRVCECLRASVVNLVASIGIRLDGMSIDRPNNDGHYSCGDCAECVTNGWPKNIQWATKLNQNRNQRDLNYVTIDGQTKCLSEWASIFGIKRGTASTRYRSGLRGKDLFAPARRPMIFTHDGETLLISEWSKRLGVEQSTLRSRWGIKGKTLKHHA